MIFRIARHTNDLKSLINFYCKILNFEILGIFENHNDYNGVFLGKPNSDWHIEFTESKEKAIHIFDEDDILVFYPLNSEEHSKIIENIKKFQIVELNPKNPYWKQNGIMIEDPDKYKIIISNLK
jgi:YycE-like N-terminal domain/YycE-like C-terminal domain